MTKNLSVFIFAACLFLFFACSNGDDSGKSDGGTDIQMVDKTAPQFEGIGSVTLNFPESVKLGWSPAKDNVTPESAITYLICISESKGECLNNFSDKKSVTGVLSYQITDLIEGKTYYFVVRARDEAGNTDTNSVEKSVLFEKSKDKNPPTFMGLSFATPGGTSVVRLLWNSASDNYTAKEKIVYSVCMSETQGGCITEFREIYKTEPGATSYDVGGLTAGKTYYFVVRATDEDGNTELNKEERSARPSDDDRFVKTYGDATYRGASAFVTLPDGYLICGGGRVGDMLDSDIFLTRLDPFGNVRWIKVFGGLKGDSCSGIAVHSDGSFYVAGSSQSFSVLGDKDLLFLKYTSGGDLQIAKRVYTDKNDLNAQVALLSDGTVVYTGYTELDNQKYDSFVILFDSNGNPLKKKFVHSEADDYVTRVKVFGDKIYLVGYTNPSSPNNYDGFLIVLDKDLNVLGQKLIGGNDYDNITAFDMSGDSELILAGQTKSFGDSDGDVYMIGLKTNTFEKSFAKVYGIDKKKDSAGDVVVYNDSYILVGDMVPPIGGDDDGILLKTDKDGNLLVKKYYRGIRDDWFTRANICPGSLCVLGGTASMHNETSEVWFLKLKDDGTTGGECKVSFVNELNVSEKSIEPVISDSNFEIKDSDISIDNVVMNYVEVGAYTDYQCVAE